MSVLPVSVYEVMNKYDRLVDYQELQNVNANDYSVKFGTHSLNDAPEDAIIGRDIFDCYDYVNTLNLGIELAKNGYDKVEVVSVSSGLSKC